jgi:hypothetical protein
MEMPAMTELIGNKGHGAPRPLDEVVPAMPFCFRLPAEFVAEPVTREPAVLTGPISELARS